MKRILLLLVMLAMFGMSYAAPLTGTKTIPGDYATLALAVADLNTNGVGTGGVTFNVAPGYTETLTAPLSITATGTATDQIIFQKNGAGVNPLLTAYVGTLTPGSAIQDGMWNLVGSDYVTINGIDLIDPNSTNPATMEYGYAMFKASVTDGCQYNTIKNCVVTLSRVNNASGTSPAVDGSRAINIMNSLVTTQTTAVTPTTAAGTNSYNKFYTNTLQNCNIGIAIIGYAAATPFTLGDTGNDIGGSSAGTGNNILNFGGATAAANPAAGVRVNNQWEVNISYNTINNNNGSGVNHPLTLRGIYAAAGTSANASIIHNTVNVNCGATTSSVYGIDNGIGSTAAANTVNINYNSVTGTYTTATTGTFYAIQNTATAATVNMNYNTVSGISTPGTGAIYGIYNSLTATNLYFTGNNVGTLTKTGIGTIYAMYVGGSPTVNAQNNTVDGLSCTAAASTGSYYGYYTIGSSAIETVSNNIFRNFTSTGAAGLYGIRIGSASGAKTLQNNQIYNFSTTGGGSIYGVSLGYGATDLISGNQIYALNSTGGTAGATYGLFIAAGTTNNIYKNSIFNLSNASAGPVVYGIYLSSGTTNNVYNNFVSDLRTPASAATISLVGIYVSGGTTANVFYNSVYLNATSTGTNFGSAALYASSTPTLDMRNNVLVNVSTPMGTGITAAYRRSSTTLTTYSANSNANAFYAGATEDVTHAVYYDGTTTYDMAAYKTLVGSSRDAVSFRENPPFINVATTPYNLHIATTPATYCESGALAVTTPFAITDDFDGNTRAGAPDVGADEFAGIAAGVINPGAFAATSISSQQLNLSYTLNPTSNNVLVVWNSTGTFTAPVGAPPSVGSAFAGGTVLSYGTTLLVSHTGLTPATPYYYKAFSYDGSAYSAGTSVTGTPTVAPPTALTAAAFSAAQINLAYTLNAQANKVIIATAATSTFGTPVNGTALNVSDPITGGGTVIYVGTLAAFNHTGLAATTAYYYKVWSADAYNYYSATGATANATTPCATISTFPFTESFAATLGCWSYSESSVGSSVHWGTATTDATHGVTAAQSGSGTYFARLDVYNATTTYNPYYFTSPTFTLDATAKQVKYYYWLGATGYTLSPVPLTLQISNNGGSTWTDLYAHTSANSTFSSLTTSPWTQNIVNLAAYVGQTVTFRFVSNSNYGSGFTNQGIDEFVIENVPSCPAPTSLTATSVTASSAVLGWTASSTNYDIEYGPAGFVQGTGTIVSAIANPYTLLGLTSNTAYAFYVRGNCPGPLQSPWEGPKTFTTLCAASTSFVETFDAVTAPALPGCWNKYTSPAFSFETVITYATAPNSTPNCVQLYSSGAALATDAPMLISPVLSNLGAGTHQLHFFAKGASTNLSVIVGTMSDPANSATFVPFQTVSGLNASTYTDCTVSFASYSGSNTYIAFQHPLTTTYSYIYIDNVSWEPIPLCPAPSALNATGITISSAVLGWTASALNYDIEYGPAGFTQGTGTTVLGVTNPYTITGLTSNTSYTFYVRANCSGPSQSTWAGPAVAFSTLCGSTTVPFNESFDTYTVPAVGCGTVIDVNADTKKWITSTSSTFDGLNKLSIGYSAVGVTMDDWYITQGIALTAGQSYDVKFQYRALASTYPERLEVKYGTTPTAAGMTSAAIFNSVDFINVAYTQGIGSFIAPTTGVYYVGWHCYSQPDEDGIYLDQINIDVTPLCSAPTALTAVPSATQASLGWTQAGTVTTWNIEWGPLGFTQGTGTTITGVTTNPYTLTGLTPSTAYAYYVQAGCVSTWSGPKTFTTSCLLTVAPFTETFESATFPAGCWTNTIVSGISEWARTSAASGYGGGSASAFADFYNQDAGDSYALTTMPFDIGSLATPTLKFDYAYATYSGEADRMDVYYSTDEGLTWTILLAMPGGTSGILNTGGTTTSAFVPTAAQWGTQTLTLPSHTNKLKFVATSAYGNSLYLDNIKVFTPLAHDASAVSIDLYDVVPSGSVTPKATVKNEGTNTETFNVTLTIGAYTSTQAVTALAPGLSQQVTFAAWTAVNGNYTATLTTALAGDLFAGNNTTSKALKVMTLDKVVYGYTTYSTTNNGPISFNLNNPGVVTQIVNEYPVTTYPGGGTWANGNWYASIYATAAPYNLVTFNTTTGARTVIGDMGVNINAMSYNTANSTMYGVGYSSSTSYLYTINLTSGLATLVGTIGSQLIINMAINNAGVCYATDLTSDVLGTINLATGAFTAVGSIGFNANYAQDMEFDRESGELYMAAYGSTGELRWVNTTTGSTLIIGQFQGGIEITGFAIPYSSSKTLNLTSVFLEGLYSGPGIMHQAADDLGPHWPAGVADHITVELHSTTAYGLVTTFSNVALSTAGTATITVPAAYNGSYRITIKHRNSIETTTAAAVSFAGSTISYAFDDPSKAFGSNMGTPLPADGHYLIFAGDVNQDGIIDTGDYEGVDNDAFNYTAGYLATDVNGDGTIDTGDFVSIDNNGFNYIGSILP